MTIAGDAVNPSQTARVRELSYLSHLLAGEIRKFGIKTDLNFWLLDYHWVL